MAIWGGGFPTVPYSFLHSGRVIFSPGRAVTALRRRATLTALGGEEINGERGEPVLARVVAAGDVREGRLGVAPGRGPSTATRPGRRSAAPRRSPHAPGPAQVEAVEVDELRVGPVRHGRGTGAR